MKLHPLEFKLFNFLNALAEAHGGQGQEVTFLLMVSGGKDSVALLHAFAKVRAAPPKPFLWAQSDLQVLHFNHQQRGAESDADAAFVGQLAAQHALSCQTFLWETWSHPEKASGNFQAMARLWRRSVAGEVVARLTNELLKRRVYVVTAHHLDDLCEGMLLNVIRGTGVEGLCGFAPIDGYFIKPFAHTPLADIVCYLNENGCVYRNDASNNTLDYRRNVIRLQILPQLEALNPAIRSALFGLSQSCREVVNNINQKQPHTASHALAVPLSAWSTPASVLHDIKQKDVQLAKNLTVKSIKNLVHHFHLLLMQSWQRPEFDWDSPAATKKIPVGSGWMAHISLRSLVFLRVNSDNA